MVKYTTIGVLALAVILASQYAVTMHETVVSMVRVAFG